MSRFVLYNAETAVTGGRCPKVAGASGLHAGPAGKKDVQQQGQTTVISHPPVICDRPNVAYRHRKLKYERMLRHFDRGNRGIGRRWQNLDAGSRSLP